VNKLKKENFKTFLLVGLFIVTFLFTQRLWINLPIKEYTSIARIKLDEINIDIANILSPQSFTINFGGGNHTVFFSEPYEIFNILDSEQRDKLRIWKNTVEDLKAFLAGDLKFEEITQEEWEEKNKFKSLRLNFSCQIPGSHLFEALRDGSKIEDEKLKDIDTILIPTIDTEKEYIYLANLKSKDFLRVKGSTSNNRVRELINNISSVEAMRNYPSYYTLGNYIGIKNNVLAPIFTDPNIPIIKTIDEVDVSDKTLVRSLANKFFGENLNFVKEIKDTNGVVIYMYGYGEKTLKMSPTGLLELIQKLDKGNIEKLNFTDSLTLACAFINEYIGWPINIENAYLLHYRQVKKEGIEGYRFTFNYRLRGLPVQIFYGNDEGPIEVEVIGNQVTYYRRIIKKPQEVVKVEGAPPFVLQVLDKNFVKLKEDYVLNRGQEEEVEAAQVLESIKSIELVYYHKSDDKTLVPAWKILLDDMVYYFELYQGDLIHSYRLNRGV